MTDEEDSKIAAREWKAAINDQARKKVVENISEKLMERMPDCELDSMALNKITDIAEKLEKNMFNKATSKDLYVKSICRKITKLDNNRQLDSSSVKQGSLQQSSSIQNPPGFSSSVSDKAVMQIKTEVFESQPLSQMASQQCAQLPYQVLPCSFQQSKVVSAAHSDNLVNRHSQQLNIIISREAKHQQLLQQPHEQLQRQKLDAIVMQQNQPFGMRNQSSVVHPKNVMNSSYQQSWGSQRHDFGAQISNSNVLNLPPNGNSVSHVKQEIVGDGLQASKSLHQHLRLVEQQKREHEMLMGISGAVTENQHVDNWHDQAWVELQFLRETHLPILKKAYEKASKDYLEGEQKEMTQRAKDYVDAMERMICFLQMPKNRLINFPKEKFLRFKHWIKHFVEKHTRKSPYPVNEQPLNHHFRAMSSASTVSLDSSSSPAPRQIASLRPQPNKIVPTPSSSELRAGNRNMLLVHKMQHDTLTPQPKSIKQELQFPWTQIQAITLTQPNFLSEASQGFQISPQIDQQKVAKDHSSMSTCSMTAELGIKPSNVCSESLQHSQTHNSVKIHDVETKIQVPSLEMTSSGTLNSLILAKNDGSNQELLKETPGIDRLLKAVETMSQETLKAAVFEINLVGKMNDTMATLSPLEEAVPLSMENGNDFSFNLKRKITATVSNEMSSPYSELEMSENLTASSRDKKRNKRHDNYALLDEMRNINQKLVETVLKLDSSEDINRRFANAGTVVQCSYSPVAVSKDLKQKVLACSRKFPVLSVRLLVPVDYPSVCPVFLTRFDSHCSYEDDESRDLSAKTRGMLRGLLRTAPEGLSLAEMAKAWDRCSRAVYTAAAGGECFSSQYGAWEDCPLPAL